MPKLITPEGEVEGNDVESRFAAAMAKPEPDEPVAPAPPRREEEGQEQPPAAAAPPAAEGKHAKRRTRAAAPRSAPARKRASKSAPPAGPEKGAYVQPVAELLESVTMVAALVPMPTQTLTARVRLQGALIDAHGAGLATAIDLAACNNATIRRGVEALTQGSAGWVLPAVMAVTPFAMASAEIWRGQLGDEHLAAAAHFEQSVHNQLRGVMEAAAADAGPQG